MLQLPSQTIFFTIERAIREYRRFAQKNLRIKHKNITIDQALVLFYLHHKPELSQNEIANLIFRDTASLTRMIDLMEKNDYITRSVNKKDRRKFIYRITPEGESVLRDLYEIIDHNRKTALAQISSEELQIMEETLNQIIANCTRTDPFISRETNTANNTI